MSAIHYKFRAAKDYDTYRFEGPGIPVWELKNEIIENKKLGKSDDFDLIITNAQTEEEYAEDSAIIPRNTSVIVKRVPVPKGTRFKRSNTERTSYMPHSIISSLNKPSAPLATSGSVEEDEKISKMMNESTSQWVTSQNASAQGSLPHHARRMARPKGPAPVPPPSYTCFRCGQPGHYINYCPTNNDPTFDRPRIKKTTGIPKAFLKTVDPSQLDCPSTAIMVTSEGAAVIAAPNEVEWEKVTAERHRSFQDIPPDLLCAFCKNLLSSPVLLSCCDAAFCDDCISEYFANEANSLCPVCKKSSSTKRVSVATHLAQKIDQFLSERQKNLQNEHEPLDKATINRGSVEETKERLVLPQERPGNPLYHPHPSSIHPEVYHGYPPMPLHYPPPPPPYYHPQYQPHATHRKVSPHGRDRGDKVHPRRSSRRRDDRSRSPNRYRGGDERSYRSQFRR